MAIRLKRMHQLSGNANIVGILGDWLRRLFVISVTLSNPQSLRITLLIVFERTRFQRDADMTAKQTYGGNKSRDKQIQIGGYVDLDQFHTIEEAKARQGRELQSKITMGEFVVMAVAEKCAKLGLPFKSRSKSRAPEDQARPPE